MSRLAEREQSTGLRQTDLWRIRFVMNLTYRNWLSCVAILLTQFAGCDLVIAHDSAPHSTGTSSNQTPENTNRKLSEGLQFRVGEPFLVSDVVDAAGDSSVPILSSDSHIVAFQTQDPNMAGGNDNVVSDLVLFDTHDGTMQRIAPAGVSTNGNSEAASLSGDGDRVAFDSNADNLIDQDVNGKRDVFLFDRPTGSISLLSVPFDGAQSDGSSHSAQISADGQSVVFVSEASNLVRTDDNGSSDIFVHSVKSGLTELIGIQDPAEPSRLKQESNDEPDISGDGRFIVFSSFIRPMSEPTEKGVANIFLYDRDTGISQLVSKGLDETAADRQSGSPSISDDGRWVVFSSNASNLVENDQNQRSDIFLFDSKQGDLQLISQDDNGQSFSNADSFSPQISGDGSYIVFQSNVPMSSPVANLVPYDIFVYEMKSGTLRRAIGRGVLTDRNNPMISSGGQFLTFSGTVEADKKEMQSEPFSSIFLVKLDN